MTWINSGSKTITINGKEIGYDLIGGNSDPYAEIVNSDESDAY